MDKTGALQRAVIPLVVLVVSTVAWSLLFLPFFPTRQGTLGHDMGYFMPMLVEGFAGLKQNGFFSPPAFSPAFCAGLPFYGTPQSIPYSLTGLLLFVTDPLAALRITLVAMHVVAWLGMYGTARLALRLDPASSALAGVLFAWSSVVAERALSGHWNFVVYGTTSLAFLGVGWAAREGARRVDVAAGAALFALTFTAWIESAFAVGAVPVGLAAVGVACMVALRASDVRGSLARGAAAIVLGGALAFLLSAPKLLPMLSFLKAAPRDLYGLPAYDNVIDAIRGIFTVVFLDPHAIEDATLLIPAMYPDAERAYTVGPVGLLAIGAVVVGFVRARRVTWTLGRGLAVVGLVAVLALPLLLTVQNDALFSLVKKLPVLKSTWSFTRWYCVYPPFIALASAMFVAVVVKDARARAMVAGVLAVFVALLHAGVDREGFHRELYDPRPMLAMHALVDDGGRLPDIAFVATPKKTSPVSFIMWNSALAQGATTVPCYEPLFGYDLETFPAKLGEGPVDAVVDGRANLADPRCYLYPEENGCAPGERFTDVDAAKAFARRDPLPFDAPALHRAAPLLRFTGFGTVVACGALLVRARRRP